MNPTISNSLPKMRAFAVKIYEKFDPLLFQIVLLNGVPLFPDIPTVQSRDYETGVCTNSKCFSARVVQVNE